MQPNDWMIELDLEDASFCAPIHKDHQKSFHFQWVNYIKKFSCLSFHQGPALSRFTKLFRTVLALIQKNGNETSDIHRLHYNSEPKPHDSVTRRGHSKLFAAVP